MSHTTIPESEIGTVETAIANGSIGKSLGLEIGDLRYGLDVARNHMQRGAYREAFQVYAMLVMCAPMELDFQIGLANCALYLSENELAIQSASAAIGIAPRDPRGYFISARACIAIGAYKEANEDLSEALRIAREVNDTAVLAEAEKLMKSLAALDS